MFIQISNIQISLSSGQSLWKKVSGLYVDLYVCIAVQLYNNKKCDLEAVCFFVLALVFGVCIF